MTLKIRNRILKFFMYVSLASIAFSVLALIYTLAKGYLIPPPTLRIPDYLNSEFFRNFSFTKQNLIPTLISFFLLAVYVPVVLFFIFRYFENTQSSEIIFFSAFLLGILCEAARFYTICFGVWQTFTNLLIFLGNIVLFGRILAPLSFACASIFSETEQRQDIERNYLIMVVSAFLFALIIPLNTGRISSAGLVTEGFMTLLNAARFILIILAVFSFYVRSVKHANKDFIPIGLWIFALYAGYVLLICADNYVFIAFGAGLLYAGTYFYLKDLHKMYMWL